MVKRNNSSPSIRRTAPEADLDRRLDDIDGRFPGSRVVAVRSILPGTKLSQWKIIERRLAAYSCEDSYGIGLKFLRSHRIPFIRNRGTVNIEVNVLAETCQFLNRSF